jgi:pimeloyl-ACP methyl ester carboxylesterase
MSSASSAPSMSKPLPFNAEILPAKNRRYAETVVFVHHFGGSRRTVLRHARMMNDLGFDVLRFDLLFNKTRPLEELPITGDFRFGVRHIWANQIEAVLNTLPGKKIIYSFSMPSASVLEAMGRRSAQDVTAWICDGGPFLELLRCTWNLYQHQYKVESRILRAAFTALSASLWGFSFAEQMTKHFANLPPSFPVLSIRSWKDPLVPVSAIEAFFALPNRVDLEVISLPEGRHLDGLKRFPEEYIPRVEKFVKRVVRPLDLDSATGL